MPVTVQVGTASILVREMQDGKFEVPLSRHQTRWRRRLRIDDAKKAYDQRTLVVPVVTNSDHFGSSEEPEPSREDLEKLSQ